VDDSACKCISDKAKAYQANGPGATNKGVYCALASNSNSVSGMLMRCCGIDMSGLDTRGVPAMDKNPSVAGGNGACGPMKCSDLP